MIGKNVSFTIASIAIDSTTGVLTVATPVAMTGKAARAAQRHRRRSAEIMALDGTIVNNVHLLDDWELELVGIRYTVTPNPVSDIFNITPYGQIVLTTPTKVYTYQGYMPEYSWDIVREENNEMVRLIPIDTGSANPAIV